MISLEKKLESAVCHSYRNNNMKLTSLVLDLSKADEWYLSTDWHLWIKDRKSIINGFHPVHCRENCDDILEQYEYIKNLIFLGDLVDDEFYRQFDAEEQDAIFGEMFDKIKNNNKYLIMGNNDHAIYKPLYEKYGFKVVDALLINETYLLTHCPVDLTNIKFNIINIHGHQHGHGFYWTVPYKSHLDIWNKDRTPVPLLYSNIRTMMMNTPIKDISHLHLKTKEEFIKFRGMYKTEDEI